MNLIHVKMLCYFQTILIVLLCKKLICFEGDLNNNANTMQELSPYLVVFILFSLLYLKLLIRVFYLCLIICDPNQKIILLFSAYLILFSFQIHLLLHLLLKYQFLISSVVFLNLMFLMQMVAIEMV